MHPSSRVWLDGLRSFASEFRAERPPRGRDRSPVERAAEEAILGDSLVLWLADLESVLAARSIMAACDTDPAIVVTTSPAGIAAVGRLLARDSALACRAAHAVVTVTELEYRLWCIRHPDEAHRHHVNLWSWLKTSVPPQRWSEFAAFPLGEGEAYWLHREGLVGGGDRDRRTCHLWRWDGRHASLLRACIEERTAPRLGDPRE